jgi:hypothetical protein
VGRVWPRHEQRGRPLNAIVRDHHVGAFHSAGQASILGDIHLQRSCWIACLRTDRVLGRRVQDRPSFQFRGNWFLRVLVSRCGLMGCIRVWTRPREISEFISTPMEGAGMVISNNALERTVTYRGPRLIAAQSAWPAAQRDR